MIASPNSGQNSFPSSHIRQRSAQFLGGAEQSIFRGLFGRVQNLADCPQLQTVVMLQLEHHALARGKLIERSIDTGSKLPAHQVAFGVGAGPRVRYLVEDVILLAL